MTEKRTRRQLLRVAGVAAVGSIAGCADMARNADGGGTSTDPSTTGSTTSTGTTSSGTGTTTSTAESSGEAAGTTEQADTYEVRPAEALDAPSRTLARAPVSSDAREHPYAVMGDDDAPVTASVFGNWKCPYTREFVRGNLEVLVDQYVAPGDVALEFRAVAYQHGDPFLGPDAPRAARAGLSVWHTDPSSYWAYFSTAFENQPPERRAWATTAQLVAFCEAADVGPLATVRRDVEGDAYAGRVRATAEDAANAGVTTVPRVVVDGETTAPTVDFGATVDALEDALR